jgi:hypothetical protein
MATAPDPPPTRPQTENLGCSGCLLFIGQAVCFVHCLAIPVATLIMLGSAKSMVNSAWVQPYMIGVGVGGSIAFCFFAALWVVFGRMRALGSPEYWRR